MITNIDMPPPAGAAFTDRTGGISLPPYGSRNLGGGVDDAPEAVRENRRRAAEELGLDPARVVYMRQVHGAEVSCVTAPFGPDAPPCDAVLTTEPGLALAVLVADCAPVLLADPDAGVVGAAHAGRLGTAAGVVPALVKEMRMRGADPAAMVAVIGPAVCGGCYEVPARLREEVCAVVPEAHCATRDGTPGLDIRAGVAAQLRAEGVADVRRDPRCTVEAPELFSHRRDRRTGRFAGYVWLGS